MIVEDEPNVRLVFRAALESETYTLTTAEDGETALRWLNQEPYDLVLLDLRMPGIGGMEVLRRLARRAAIPVVVITAHDSVANAVEAMKLGAIDFLAKPLTPKALRRMVAEVLAHHPANEPEQDLAAAQRKPATCSQRQAGAEPSPVLPGRGPASRVDQGTSGPGRTVVSARRPSRGATAIRRLRKTRTRSRSRSTRAMSQRSFI